MVTQDRAGRAERSPFGELLVRFRTEMGLTQSGLAQATTSARVSPRSITNYEKSTIDPRDWILPHRPTIRALSTALALSDDQHRQLTDAWGRSRQRKEASAGVNHQQAFTRAGREHVLQQLQDRWRIATAGTPQIVMIGAEAGMGKSSIASYFCDWVAANYHPAMVTWGESTNYGATTEPYTPIRYATDRLLVPPMASFTIPGAYANRPQLTLARVHEILTFLPKLMGALLSDRTIANLGNLYPEIPAETFRTILAQNVATEALGRWDEYARLLHTLSQDWPILIVLEDLHWAGDLTAALLSHLLHNFGRATRTPVMIIGTVRSDEIESQKQGQPSRLALLIRELEASPIGTYLSMADTISPVNGREFIRTLVGAFPMAYEADESDIVEFLYSHTAGQPLLTKEMLRHLRESGALTQQVPTDLWTFDASAIKEGLPSAISSFIEQRLERVPRRGKALLEASAVMGEWMLPEVVATVLGLDVEETRATFDSELAARHHLIQPVDSYLIENHHTRVFRFSHALVRDYVYSTVPIARRDSLHIGVAKALEAIVDDHDMNTIGSIANHYARARDWYAAEMAAYRAAQISISRMDWDLSEFWFEQAEELAVKAKDPRQLWRTRAARVSMLRGLRRYGEAIELTDRVLRQVAYHEWPSVEALARHHLGEVRYDLGEFTAAIEEIGRAQELHIKNNDLSLAAAASAMLSHSYYRLGHFDSARERALEALSVSRPLENSWVTSEALLAAANCEIDLGYYELALENYQAAIDIARTVGKLKNELIPLMNIGLCFTFMGQHEKAVTHLQETLEQVETKLTHTYLQGPPLFYLGLAYEALGELENARDAYQRSFDVRETDPPMPTQLDGLTGVLRIAMAEGDRSLVEVLLQELETRIETVSWQSLEYPLLALTTLANAHRMLGDDDAYAERIREAHAELMHRASLLADPEAVESYLHRVQMNVEVQQRFAELASS